MKWLCLHDWALLEPSDRWSYFLIERFALRRCFTFIYPSLINRFYCGYPTMYDNLEFLRCPLLEVYK